MESYPGFLRRGTEVGAGVPAGALGKKPVAGTGDGGGPGLWVSAGGLPAPGIFLTVSLFRPQVLLLLGPSEAPPT